jgi:F-type H+-transporting ATPase subunit c
LGLGLAISKAMESVGRQPEAANKILINMLVCGALIEGIFVLTWVFAFMLKAKI